MKDEMRKDNFTYPLILTAGATYLDIDAYACMVSMTELMTLQGRTAVAWSDASGNYSVVPSLVAEGQVRNELPEWEQDAGYMIVDVSDPDYLKRSIPLERVVAVYDHHVGFENYWTERIGGNACIEFIGAAATLIYREWKTAGLQDRMSCSSAKLLLAAILDNTLNLTSANTTQEDRDAYRELCALAGIGEEWRGCYFSEVQKTVEADLKNALLGDLKTVRGNPVLPPYVAQLCVWDAASVLERLEEIRGWFDCYAESWMMNIIELKNHCNYFVCDDPHHQQKLAEVFDVSFHSGVAQTTTSYLRKELIKKTHSICKMEDNNK